MRKKQLVDINFISKRERLERLAQKVIREIEVFLASRDSSGPRVSKDTLGSMVTKERCCPIN